MYNINNMYNPEQEYFSHVIPLKNCFSSLHRISPRDGELTVSTLHTRGVSDRHRDLFNY